MLIVQHVARQGFQVSLHCVLIDVGRHDEGVVDVRDETLATLVFPLVEPQAAFVPSKLVAGNGQLERRIVDSLDIREGDFQHCTCLSHGDVGTSRLLDVTYRGIDCLARIAPIGDREASKFVAEGVYPVFLTLLCHPISRLLHRVSFKVESNNLVPANVCLQVLHCNFVVLCSHKNLVLRELVQTVVINHRLVTDHAS